MGFSTDGAQGLNAKGSITVVFGISDKNQTLASYMQITQLQCEDLFLWP